MTENSMLLKLTKGDLRLISLGSYQLEERRGSITPVAESLDRRLGLAGRVIHLREEAARGQANLLDTSSRGYTSAARVNEEVELRLRADEIAEAVAALQAFLERTDPTMHDDKLVDPPEKVTPLLRRLEAGLKGLEAQEKLAAAELDLLA